MTTQVSIANVALSQLGANLINSFNEGTTEATLCNTFWDQARLTLLVLHPWNFAITRIEIAQDVTAPVYGYEYQYTLPSDCLRVLQVYHDDDYKIEGRKLLSNRSSCFIKYLKDEDDVAVWSQGFIDLMSAKLRLDLAYPITKASSELANAKALYDEALMRAKAIDASEDIADPYGQLDNSFIAVRG